jgi:hypothetical protein
VAREKILARDFVFELSTDGGTTWLPIGGIETWSPSSDITRTDDTDFDSDGWAEHKVVARGRSLTLEGFYKEDPSGASGTPLGADQDPGQAALIDLSDAIGYASVQDFRITSPGGNKTEGKVSADVTFGGGDKNGNASFSAQLTWQGQPAYTPAPAVP